MGRWYKLHSDRDSDGNPTVVPCTRDVPSPDETTWAIVKRTDVGDVLVSTVFMGLDHNYGDSGPPILFETMIFGGKLNQAQSRQHTWREALEAHERTVVSVEQVEGRKRTEEGVE